MAGQLIPPPDLDTRSQKHLTGQQRIAAWFQWCEFVEAFWLAGLQRTIGANGDLRSQVRSAYAGEMDSHDRMMLRLLNELDRREANDAI